MKHLVESNTYQSHLLHIETLIQSEPDLDYRLEDTERLLFCSIEEAREEIRRRYHDTLQEPLFIETDAENHRQVGMVFSYEADVANPNMSENLPHRDLVRVFKLQGETVDSEQWKPIPAIKESHLEEELCDAIQKLLDCSELNMDDMEPDTRSAIGRALSVLGQVRSKQ